jgi:hypothetical protein
MGKSKIKEIEDVHHLTTLNSDPEQRRHHVQPHALVLAEPVQFALQQGQVLSSMSTSFRGRRCCRSQKDLRRIRPKSLSLSETHLVGS